jgi:hypothetical protein
MKHMDPRDLDEPLHGDTEHPASLAGLQCGGHSEQALSSPYDDPHYQPPADIEGSEARAYEAKILEVIRRALLPGSRTSVIKLEGVELRGERPDTEVIFMYTDTRHPGQRFARRTWLWKDPYRWPLVDAPGFTDRLNSASDVAGWVGGAFSAYECDSIEVPDDGDVRR